MDGSHERCNQIDTGRTHELGPKHTRRAQATASREKYIQHTNATEQLYWRVLTSTQSHTHEHASTSTWDAQPVARCVQTLHSIAHTNL